VGGGRQDQLLIESPELQRLFIDWMIHLLDEHYGVKSRSSAGGGTPWSITLADDSVIQVELNSFGQFSVEGRAKYKNELATLAKDAHTRTLALDYGKGAWWSASFSTDLGATSVGMLHFMRFISEHNSRRFSGDWRLGNEALISFKQGNMQRTPVAFPKFDVEITFRVPAPGPGPHAEAIAEGIGTFLRAATSFATAAPLLGSPPLWPAEAKEVEEVMTKLLNAPELPVERGGPNAPALDMNQQDALWPLLGSLLTLPESVDAQQPVSLTPDPESVEALRRVQGAMFAYEQAIQQESEYVAITLLVSALEALSVPNTSWQQDRVSTRFFRFVQELCPETVSEIMRHGNFAQTFGPYSSPRRFLDQLYSLRSKPLHTGFVQNQLSTAPGMKQESQIRVMLASWLVRAGIARFLRRAFSSLIGHPVIAPAGSDRSSVRPPR
jgi:hypothetical protein